MEDSLCLLQLRSPHPVQTLSTIPHELRYSLSEAKYKGWELHHAHDLVAHF